MPQGPSAILLTFIKLPFAIKIFGLTIFEWPFYTGFTVPSNRATPQLYLKETYEYIELATLSENSFIGSMPCFSLNIAGIALYYLTFRLLLRRRLMNA